MLVAALLLVAASGDAQWLKQPTRGIPRTRDGKPNLKAKAPRSGGHPDLTGLWSADPEGYGVNVVADLKPGDVQPWADAIYQQRSKEFGKDHPAVRCLPEIGPFSSFGMFKILQTRDVTAVLTGGGIYRQIHTDGRVLPKDPQPTWLGYSVGRWEGDTFIVETEGFNDRTWLDFGGHPHTEALHVTERFRRKDFGHMDVQMTFTDPKAYNRPWTISFEAEYRPDTELLEYVCNENEKDAQRMLVHEEERTFQALPAATLARYAGGYDLQLPGGGKQPYAVTVTGDHLMMKPEGVAGYEAFALSETRFTAGGTVLDFTRDETGVATGFVIYTVEGELKAVRK